MEISLQKQVTILLLLLGAIFLMMLFPGWQWAFMGLVCASLCHPWVKKVRKLFKSQRPVAVAIFLTFLILISLVPILILVLVVDVQSLGDFESIKSILEKMHELFNRMSASIVETLGAYVSIDKAAVTKASTDLLKSLSGFAGRGVGGVLGAGPELITNFFIFLISFYYALMCFRKLRRGIMEVPVFNLRFKAKLLRTFSENAYSSIVAAGGTAFVQALILGIGMVSVSYDHWVLGTVIAFMAAFIPVVGTLPVSAVVIIQLAIQGNGTQAIIFLIVATVAGVSDNFIRPMFLKGSADMHPWIALVSVLGGLVVFGMWGLFIGPIAVGLLITTWKEWMRITKPTPRVR